MLGEIAGLVEKGALTPLPFRSFPACRIDAAFRLMASGKHIGKVVVAFPEAFVPRRGEPLAAAIRDQAGRLLISSPARSAASAKCSPNGWWNAVRAISC